MTDRFPIRRRRPGFTMKAVLAAALPFLLTAAPASIGWAQEAGRYSHYEVYEADLLPRAEYAAHRKRVLDVLAEEPEERNVVMLVRSSDVRNRNNDVDYQYRQRSNLLYLCGVTEDDCALLLLARPISVGGVRTREVLFVAERVPQRETWTGIRMGPEVASAVTGIATVLPMPRLRGLLDSVLASTVELYYDGFMHDEETEPLTGTTVSWNSDMTDRLTARFKRLRVHGADQILDGMRVRKSEAEMKLLRKAIDISVEAHRATIAGAAPGMTEYQLAATMEYEFHTRGSEAPGYPSIVGSGPNTCILHYESNRRVARAGELVLMDCGAEYHGYTADVTRTFPVSGHFTTEQRAIYDIVYEAQTAGIAQVRAGNNFRLAHRKATEVIVAGLKRLGIIDSAGQVMRYFMHGTSHFLGLDVHDVGEPGMLASGMVLTVEPGIYIPAGSRCDPKWWNIGIRIEDDILVTDGDPVNLSGALARSADDIEALMVHSSGSR